MGGYGSGRWERPTRKTTVEECTQLNVSDFAKHGLLKIGSKGELRWPPHNPVDHVASIRFHVAVNQEGDPVFLINYHWSNCEQSESIETSIKLDMTRPRFGGLCWWFLCPLSFDGKPCSRRVAKLYLPPEGRHFGCRTCHDLTYQSAQRAHWLKRLPGRIKGIEKYVNRLVEEQLERSNRPT